MVRLTMLLLTLIPMSQGQSALLMRYLTSEFAPELRRLDGERNREACIESIDIRSSSIVGAPLTDGCHSAQTIVNDYVRPFGQGENVYAGYSVRAAAAGPFSSYLRMELQKAAIAAADFAPAADAGPASGFTRGRVLEAYISFASHNNQITFGKQALWWGPGKGGLLLFSNNAEPLTVQVSLRHASASQEFLRGENLGDIGFTTDIALRRDWQLCIAAHEERWRFPVLSTTAANNLAATFQLSYQPSERTP